MDDRCIMENLLMTTKGVCDLYFHGTIESSTQNVHQAFDQALDSSLCMQDDIYKKCLQRVGIPQKLQSNRKCRR